jgi:hypothetical protein
MSLFLALVLVSTGVRSCHRPRAAEHEPGISYPSGIDDPKPELPARDPNVPCERFAQLHQRLRSLGDRTRSPTHIFRNSEVKRTPFFGVLVSSVKLIANTMPSLSVTTTTRSRGQKDRFWRRVRSNADDEEDSGGAPAGSHWNWRGEAGTAAYFAGTPSVPHGLDDVSRTPALESRMLPGTID